MTIVIGAGQPYSEDLRERIVGAVEAGASRRQAARKYGVSASCAIKLVRRWRTTGSVSAAPQGAPKRSKLDAHGDWLLGLIADEPDITLEEVRARLKGRGVQASIGLIWGFFDKHDISFKKKTAHAAEQEREDVALARVAWKDQQRSLDPSRLVFVDETGTATNMAPRCGRCRRGERLIGRVPHGHWKTTTFVAGLRCDAVVAPFVVDRPMNGDIFKAYVEQCLAPTLTPGDIVIMDNLAAHKVAGVREMIERTGASLCYLPPYSPDFNPIEQAFAKLKALLRKAAARTIPDLWDTIAKGLDSFTPQECAAYFINSGYEPE
ncbi:MAG: IS630 family transposase [Pseudomonadota bacterium]